MLSRLFRGRLIRKCDAISWRKARDASKVAPFVVILGLGRVNDRGSTYEYVAHRVLRNDGCVAQDADQSPRSRSPAPGFAVRRPSPFRWRRGQSREPDQHGSWASGAALGISLLTRADHYSNNLRRKCGQPLRLLTRGRGPSRPNRSLSRAPPAHRRVLFRRFQSIARKRGPDSRVARGSDAGDICRRRACGSRCRKNMVAQISSGSAPSRPSLSKSSSLPQSHSARGSTTLRFFRIPC